MILVFGKTGQVAQELARLDNVTCLGREDADLNNPDACAQIIHETTATAIINAAAWTAVDKAEEDEHAAHVVNCEAPTAMAKAAAMRGIPFVHISTDYVFAGDGDTPWSTHSPVAPQNAYGRTKAHGEAGVRNAGGTHAILRTSWVVSAHGNNFVKTMLRLGADKDALTIVADQIGGPTASRDIAITCHKIATQLLQNPTKSGTYHFCGTPKTSWADFAVEIFKQAGVTCTVKGIPSSDYPTSAVRPLNSRMDCSQTELVFGVPQPDWRESLAHILSDLETQT